MQKNSRIDRDTAFGDEQTHVDPMNLAVSDKGSDTPREAVFLTGVHTWRHVLMCLQMSAMHCTLFAMSCARCKQVHTVANNDKTCKVNSVDCNGRGAAAIGDATFFQIILDTCYIVCHHLDADFGDPTWNPYNTSNYFSMLQGFYFIVL